MKKQTLKWAKRFLKRNEWNLTETKLETMPDGKVKNLLKNKEKAIKILKGE